MIFTSQNRPRHTRRGNIGVGVVTGGGTVNLGGSFGSTIPIYGGSTGTLNAGGGILYTGGGAFTNHGAGTLTVINYSNIVATAGTVLLNNNGFSFRVCQTSHLKLGNACNCDCTTNRTLDTAANSVPLRTNFTRHGNAGISG